MTAVTVFVVAVTALCLDLQCQYYCRASRLRAVGEDCKPDDQCVSEAQCGITTKKCTCRDSYSHLADFSACVLVGKQNVTQRACTQMDDCIQNIEGANRCLVLTPTKSSCICDPGYDINVPDNTTCTLPCTDHEFCAQNNPANLCLNNTVDFASNALFCRMKPCSSDAGCTPDTKCMIVVSIPERMSCQLTSLYPKSSDRAGGVDIPKLNRSMTSYLEIGMYTIAGGFLLLIICGGVILSGACSGEPGSSPIKGRGVPLIRDRILCTKKPKAQGPGPGPQAPVTSSSRTPSVQFANKAPSAAGSMSSAGPRASPESSVYESSVVSESVSKASSAKGGSGTSVAESSVVSSAESRTN